MDFRGLKRELQSDTLNNLWLITGTEPLLMIEAADAIREKARTLGYEEREVLNASANWDWNQLLESCQAMSLFGSQKIVELRLSSFRPGTKGAEMLSQIGSFPLDGVILIVSIPYDWSIKKLKWFTSLSSAAQTVMCDTVDAKELPQWFTERLSRQKQSVTVDALKLLCDRCEGNLLAAKQELLKLAYQHPEGTEITADMVESSVTDVSRYDAENLLEATMKGDAAKAIRIVESLQGEGIAIPAFLWMLTDEIRSAARMRAALDDRQDPFTALRSAGVYGVEKQNRVKAAARRCTVKKLTNALALCADIDLLAKGLTVKPRDSDPWIELMNLVSFVAH